MTEHVAWAVLVELGVLSHAQKGQATCGEPRRSALADHVVHPHMPLWVHEGPEFSSPYAGESPRPLYEVLTADSGVEGVLSRTRIAVFLGSHDSPTFRRFFDAPDVLLLVIETCGGRLEQFAQSVPASKHVNSALIYREPALLPGACPALGRVVCRNAASSARCPGGVTLQQLGTHHRACQELERNMLGKAMGAR